jgi:hypothetical protein
MKFGAVSARDWAQLLRLVDAEALTLSTAEMNRLHDALALSIDAQNEAPQRSTAGPRPMTTRR